MLNALTIRSASTQIDQASHASEQPLGVTAVDGAHWEPAGHATTPEWVLTFQHIAPWLFAALLTYLVVRAWLSRSRYRAVSVLDQDAVERIRAAVATVEESTVGEVAVVVLERSDDHPQAPWAGAVAFVGLATIALWSLIAQAALTLPVLVFAQLLAGAAAYFAVRSVPHLARTFVSAARATEMAEEQAIQEFHALGLRDTVKRTGVLLFVSLFERRVIVLADEGIASEVDAALWVEVDRAILKGARESQLEAGLLEAGLLEGIALAGAVLADHFPAQAGGANQVTDHVIVRRA